MVKTGPRHFFLSLFIFLAANARGQTLPSFSERSDLIASRVEDGCRGVEQGLNSPTPQPSVRQLTSAALGWLELGKPAERAEKLVRYAFGLQNMSRFSSGFGTVPWQQGHPEIKDPNAIEFTMQPVAVILLRHATKLSDSFKKEARPHIRSAISAIHQHHVPVRYSNIYLMKLVNLLLLGQAVGDDKAVAEGRANFETWLAVTRKSGISEYDSPTYSPIQANCLALAHDLTSDLELRAMLKSALDLYWADFTANYFPGRQTMTGPASRNYNSGFLFSDSNVENLYYLAGLRSNSPADTLLSDKVRTWTVARMGGYQVPAEILELAHIPERVVRSRFGKEPGQDRYLYMTPDYSIGSASAYYGPQDRPICVEFATEKKLPLIGFVADALDAPFGMVRSNDRGGHNKPHNLPHLIATVQEKDVLLALMDLSPALRRGAFTNLASNVILPVRVDQLVLNGKLVDVSKPFALACNHDSVAGLREGKAAVAIRIFSADGCAAQSAAWKLEFDGNEEGAGRLVVHHFRGDPQKLTEKNVRCGLIMQTARCETEEEFFEFLRRVAQIKLVERMQDGVWQVTAKSSTVQFEAGLDLKRKQIAFRRVNGQRWQTETLSMNGRDLAAETLLEQKPLLR